MSSQPTRREIILTGGAATLAGLAGCGSPLSTSSPEQETDDSDGTQPDAQPDDYTEIYEATIDSVVLVETDGQGTGFMYDDQHVITNAHVVGTAQSARVRFTEGRWSTARVVGSDPHSDLAVLAVDDVPEAASPLSFADDDPEVGQRVLAIGNPYNLNGTMTSGIISGVNRSIPSPAGFEIPDAIQTDAPVNPGNSGGPLVDLDGDVVAVINSGGGDNIGFGISAALTQRVIPELLTTGDYEHAYMGVSFEDVTPTVARVNDLPASRGLLVVGVAPGGPSDGRLQPSSEISIVDGERVPVGGDVIRAVDDTTIETSEALGSYLALETNPGETVDVTVLRDGREQTVQIELGTRPTGV